MVSELFGNVFFRSGPERRHLSRACFPTDRHQGGFRLRRRSLCDDVGERVLDDAECFRFRIDFSARNGRQFLKVSRRSIHDRLHQTRAVADSVISDRADETRHL